MVKTPVKTLFDSLWHEPAVTGPPPVGPRDWLLGAGVALVTVGELLFRSRLVWWPAAAVLGFGLAGAVVMRRSQPLAGVTFGFVGFAVLDVATRVLGTDPVVLYAGTAVLVLAYSLFRWGSGRSAFIGLVVMEASTAVIIATNFTGLADAIGGPIVVLFVAALGGAVRYRSTAQAERVRRGQLQERELLARELHDTVAHHVSAIAIQAQAGLFMARESSLAGATEALEIIAAEATRTLNEMRVMVSALRDQDAPPDLAPSRGLADIERLGLTSNPGTIVEVQLEGDLANLSPALEAALYRVAQESVTNALRHAHLATRIVVHLYGATKDVTLTITDNGTQTSSEPHPTGFGLAGMTERLTLLNGALTAGPNSGQGWTVNAVLPRPQGRT